MRMTHAWANVVQTNSFLRVLTIGLGISATVMAVALMKLSGAPPLIVERSCQSRVMTNAGSGQTELEIKAFLKDALEARFNTLDAGLNLHLLSVSEVKKRALEQAALLKKGMKQRILLEEPGIELSGSGAKISADRLISVKDIRSALTYRLQTQFAVTKRSKLNPYGLVLTSVSEAKADEKKGGQ